jgi:hypothetical protein
VQPKIANTMGSENNYIAVKRSDFEVFEALTSDAASMLSTTHSYQDERKQRDANGKTSVVGSLPEFVSRIRA